MFLKGSEDVSWHKARPHLVCKETMDKTSLKLL